MSLSQGSSILSPNPANAPAAVLAVPAHANVPVVPSAGEADRVDNAGAAAACAIPQGLDTMKVRLSRFQFCQRRLKADALPGAKRPLRAYSDETYVHAHHWQEHVWPH